MHWDKRTTGGSWLKCPGEYEGTLAASRSRRASCVVAESDVDYRMYVVSKSLVFTPWRQARDITSRLTSIRDRFCGAK